MIALLSGWIGKVWGYVLVIGAIVAAVVAVLAKAFSAGKTSEREAGEAQQLENVATRNTIDAAVAARSDADNRERLRKLYTRGQ